ncbi:histone-lysine N-methyltransferase SETMAR-like [Aplysia californica]|uniref:Histone-lysine N-methyltransferase SETMAR-like n=1 Tax=Aplysia californica TaxID=6500 RepID=A0ABM0JVZ0_APLCA|nr:histone-lysine N-methyltransferase SETMAR-like [Aplysia californica]
MLSDGVVLLHDNATPHKSAQTQNLIASFGGEQLKHPSYNSPDLAPSDFHDLFLHLKKFLAGQDFDSDADLTEETRHRLLTSQAAAFYDGGIQKLIPRYDKCLNSSGDYVEK